MQQHSPALVTFFGNMKIWQSDPVNVVYKENNDAVSQNLDINFMLLSKQGN